MHLLSNMLGLYFFGREVGRAFGGRALLGLYIAGGLAGSTAHCIWRFWQIRGMPLRAPGAQRTSGLELNYQYVSSLMIGLMASAQVPSRRGQSGQISMDKSGWT